MAEQKTLVQNIKWKLTISVVLAVIFWVVAGVLGFPPIFQAMFVAYVVLGFAIFVLLDLPPMKELTGGMAFVGIIGFYALCSAALLAASHALPQFDPEWEKGKIDKILMRKRDRFTSTTIHDLYASSQALMEKADAIMARLEQLEGGGGGIEIDMEALMARRAARKPGEKLSPEEMVAYGKEVYDLYECYNCHKIGGKGATKKRGPKLDNIGNLLKAEDMKTKIWDPNTLFYAKGFEKEHKKELMPDNYSEIMDDEELDTLVAYLMTLKNTRVKTPKPIFHDHEQHKK